jgi:hypothetical protein
LAGTRARGKTRIHDFEIGQDLLLRFTPPLPRLSVLNENVDLFLNFQGDINTLYENGPITDAAIPCSVKEDTEFTIVRDSIKKKLEAS